MPDNPRATAIERLEQMRDCLRQGTGDLSDFVEQTEQVISAIKASHIEGVRFRLFGLRRQLTAYTGQLPDQVTVSLEEATAALREAGFRT